MTAHIHPDYLGTAPTAEPAPALVCAQSECGETFTTTGTVNGQDAATWAYLQHLRENHGED